MGIDYLERFELAINNGGAWLTCPGTRPNEWHFSESLDELRARAMRTAGAQNHDVHIYRVLPQAAVAPGESFLFVRKILEPDPRGEPRLQWSLADTREAAELMRDVSEGPSPYFGVAVCETFSCPSSTSDPG